jgi:hypothetical protein
VVMPSQGRSITTVQQDVCGEAQRYSEVEARGHLGAAAIVLFPEEPSTGDNYQYSFTVEEVKNARNFLIPMVVGCIDYRFDLSPSHHQTRFIYDILTTRAEAPGIGFAITPERGNIPAVRLHTQRSMIPGAFFAN